MSRLFKKPLLSLAIALLALPTIVLASQSKDDFDPLKPFTTCEMGGDLKVKDITRRPKSAEKYREVSTDKGDERVSVVDGYRVMFGYKDVRYYFANVKIERSDPKSYGQDKERVINQLKHFSSTKQATKIQYTGQKLLNGFEHYGIDRDVIDVGGQVGIHVLFDDTKHLIITIYLLNQEKKNRRFNNIEEYHALKADFLNRYSECLRAKTNQ
jgi:hypothetical protein